MEMFTEEQKKRYKNSLGQHPVVKVSLIKTKNGFEFVDHVSEFRRITDTMEENSK